jgi:ribosomal protein S18 acetylase RimI-like enzyme
MITQIETNVRPATQEDRQRVASLVHFESHIHRHLDWKSALDWLGDQPYLLVERNRQLVGALACPPDPPGIAWIRIFAVADTLSPSFAWQLLWPAARKALVDLDTNLLAAIPIQPWMRKLLNANGFTHTHGVVLLAWEGELPPPRRPHEKVKIRTMTRDDLPMVAEIDAQSFGHLWRNSRASLEVAYQQSVVATVAEAPRGVVGYQISTQSPLGGHLARLAVHPEEQSKGIGYALVREMQAAFIQRGVHQVTVNTQHDNDPSLALYLKTGFQPTGEEYPVYQISLS